MTPARPIIGRQDSFFGHESGVSYRYLLHCVFTTVSAQRQHVVRMMGQKSTLLCKPWTGCLANCINPLSTQVAATACSS